MCGVNGILVMYLPRRIGAVGETKSRYREGACGGRSPRSSKEGVKKHRMLSDNSCSIRAWVGCKRSEGAESDWNILSRLRSCSMRRQIAPKLEFVDG